MYDPEDQTQVDNRVVSTVTGISKSNISNGFVTTYTQDPNYRSEDLQLGFYKVNPPGSNDSLTYSRTAFNVYTPNVPIHIKKQQFNTIRDDRF